MKFQTMAPYWWRCCEWCRTGSKVVDDCSWVDCKGRVGVGEGNSWWLGRFKGVFRYWFGRLYSEVGWFNFILRRIKRKLLSLCFVLFFVGVIGCSKSPPEIKKAHEIRVFNFFRLQLNSAINWRQFDLQNTSTSWK